MLGDKTAATQLQPYLMQDNKLQQITMNTTFRAMPIEQGRSWISQLSGEASCKRVVIAATGVLGDPQAVPWLIEKMRMVDTAKLAAESFSMITGIDLEKYGLSIEAPEDISVLPNEEPKDSNVEMDADENLPFPDVDKVAYTWQKHGSKFYAGKRYFMGKEIDESNLQIVIQTGLQRQRTAAAYELSILNSHAEFANVKARIVL
jgi:uncharacterized protein (TIGR02270 family)